MFYLNEANQCPTGKPITMTTANVGIKQSAKVSFLISIGLDAWATADLQEFSRALEWVIAKAVPMRISRPRTAWQR